MLDRIQELELIQSINKERRRKGIKQSLTLRTPGDPSPDPVEQAWVECLYALDHYQHVPTEILDQVYERYVKVS